jgi:hypothetical protein
MRPRIDHVINRAILSYIADPDTPMEDLLRLLEFRGPGNSSLKRALLARFSIQKGVGKSE